jgi:uncharacterized membrane protein
MIDLTSLHQKVIHFPIALLSIYPFFELFALIKKSEFIDKANLILLILGTLSLTITLISGNIALNSYNELTENLLTKKEVEIINNHLDFANYLAWTTAFLFLSRIYFNKKIKQSNYIRVLIIIISFLVLYFLYYTGEFGGKTNELLIFNKRKLIN